MLGPNDGGGGIWRLLSFGGPWFPGAAALAGGRGAAGGLWWAAFHGRAGGVGAADAGAVAAPRNPSWLHVEDPPLLRSVPIRAGAGPWRRLRRPLWPAWRIWRAGEVPGETPGWRGSLPKVDAFGADPLPEGFGLDPLPSASSSSYGESFCSPGLGVDGTLVSCSFLKAAAGNSSWWRGCWWRGGGALRPSTWCRALLRGTSGRFLWWSGASSIH